MFVSTSRSRNLKTFVQHVKSADQNLATDTDNGLKLFQSKNHLFIVAHYWRMKIMRKTGNC